MAEIMESAFDIVDSIRNSGNVTPEISYYKLVIPLVLAVVIYLASLMDTFIAYRKSIRKWNEWKLTRVHGEYGDR